MQIRQGLFSSTLIFTASEPGVYGIQLAIILRGVCGCSFTRLAGLTRCKCCAAKAKRHIAVKNSAHYACRSAHLRTCNYFHMPSVLRKMVRIHEAVEEFPIPASLQSRLSSYPKAVLYIVKLRPDPDMCQSKSFFGVIKWPNISYQTLTFLCSIPPHILRPIQILSTLCPWLCPLRRRPSRRLPVMESMQLTRQNPRLTTFRRMRLA